LRNCAKKLEYVLPHGILIKIIINAHYWALQLKDQRLKSQGEQLKGTPNANESAEVEGGDVDSKIRLLRKEVMGKIRDLEDEIQEIKYRLRM